MSETRCRACRAELAWARTEANGRPMPLDPKPDVAGNVALRRGDGVAVAEVLAGVELAAVRARADRPLYVPHFATCPGWAKPVRRRRSRSGNVVDLDERRRRTRTAP